MKEQEEERSLRRIERRDEEQGIENDSPTHG